MPNTTDKTGREWATLSTLKHGDPIEIDAGFTCAPPGLYACEGDASGLYFECDHGKHYLAGQLEINGDSLIGVYKA